MRRPNPTYEDIIGRYIFVTFDTLKNKFKSSSSMARKRIIRHDVRIAANLRIISVFGYPKATFRGISKRKYYKKVH